MIHQKSNLMNLMAFLMNLLSGKCIKKICENNFGGWFRRSETYFMVFTKNIAFINIKHNIKSVLIKILK